MGAPGKLISILEIPHAFRVGRLWDRRLSARGGAFVDMGLVTICQSQSGSGGGHTAQGMPG